MSAKLAVVVPVYNGMPFLKETVESLLNQTYQDFRLLIIDDGSTDESLNYLKSLTDPRVEVRHQSNMGLCLSLNRAIESCDAEYIARLDQDDVALPSRLQEQMAFLTSHPDYACILTNVSKMVDSGKEFGSYDFNSAEEICNYDSSLYGCIVHSTICFQKKAFINLGGYRPLLYPVDDYDLLLRFEENYQVAVINKPLVKYRIHSKAGTFKTFNDMEFKTRYALQMAARRRKGQPEISLAEFGETVDRLNWWQKWRRDTRSMGKLMFRKAGLMLGAKQVVAGTINLAGAFLLAPQFTTKRLFALSQSRKS